MTSCHVLACSRSVYIGHHAFVAESDANLPTRVTDRVVKVESINPSAWEQVQCDQEGRVVWRLEAGTPPHLA
ncbi:MAG: DUF6152 family protein [Bryobacterales bacterium]|nr:DUF6152 family protein [Bryobacterales bacterium]